MVISFLLNQLDYSCLTRLFMSKINSSSLVDKFKSETFRVLSIIHVKTDIMFFRVHKSL